MSMFDDQSIEAAHKSLNDAFIDRLTIRHALFAAENSLKERGQPMADGWRPRPIKPDDKAILVKLNSPSLNMNDGEFLVLTKYSNGNWHSSAGNIYIIGEDFDNLVWPLPPVIDGDAATERKLK